MAPKWQAKGDYFETCNCQTLCPCIFLSPPTEGNCTVLVGWHIESGKFGDASLDGLNVAAFFYSPGPMPQGNWSAALYLDSRASSEQSDALLKIFSGQAGGVPAALHPLIGKGARCEERRNRLQRGWPKAPHDRPGRRRIGDRSTGGCARGGCDDQQSSARNRSRPSGHRLALEAVEVSRPWLRGRSQRQNRAVFSVHLRRLSRDRPPRRKP